MKRALIIGASVLQLPAIKKAKELGYYVGVVDYNPSAIGVAYADEYFNVSTNDIDGVVKVAQKFQPDGIMTLATDMPMRSVAGASQACHLPGISMETAIKATDKGEMIKAFAAAGVEHPWFYIVKTDEELKKVKFNIHYPCIVKPVDSSGSRGVALVENESNLYEAYSYAHGQSNNGEVIIEEYLQGREVSVEVIALNDEPHILQVTDKLTTGAPHFVEMGHSQPSCIDKVNLERIKDLARRAVQAIGIKNGAAHVEIMLTANGPKMIELGARMGGDCITTHLVPLSTGIDMVKATLDLACGNVPDINATKNVGSAIRYFYAPAGIIKDITGIDEAKQVQGVQEITFVHHIGEGISEINSSGDRIGFVIATGNDAVAAIKACEEAIKRITITVFK